MDGFIRFLIITSVCTLISFQVSLIFIFKKAGIKWYLALIPLVNLFYYARMLRISPIWMYLPLFNIVVFIVSPILLGYHFRQRYWLRSLGMFFPMFFYPFIAFSPTAFYIHIKRSDLNLHSVNDIDTLERKIKKDVAIYDNDTIPTRKKKKIIKARKNVEEKIEPNFVDVLDMKLGQMQKTDVIVTDEDLLAPVAPVMDENPEYLLKKEIIVDVDLEELDELNSNDTFEDISNKNKKVGLQNVQSMEQQSIEASKFEYTDSSTYTELAEHKKTDAQIAFNVEDATKKDDKKVDVLEARHVEDSHKCPRCGSDLAGFHEYCPGCGADIRELTKEK